MASDFTANRAMPIKHSAEDVAFLAGEVLSILTQLRLIKIKGIAGIKVKKQCTCIGDANNKVQRYGCANVVLNVPAQVDVQFKVSGHWWWAIKMVEYIISSGC